jgi:hypothetical protein
MDRPVAVHPDKFASADASALWAADAEPDLYLVVPYLVALRHRYETDAHVTTGVVHDVAGLPMKRQPRLKKEDLRALREHGYGVLHHVRMADVDRPNHAAMTAESLAEAARYLSGSGWLWYPTAHGLRIVELLTEPVTPEVYEHHQVPWIRAIQRKLGPTWVADPMCRDWTRHFRLPRVKRRMADGRNVASHETVVFGDANPKAKTLATDIDAKVKPTRTVGAATDDPQAAAIGEVIAGSMPPSISGQGGHLALLRVTRALFWDLGLSAVTTASLLVAAYNPRCAPPWSAKELGHKIKEIANGKGIDSELPRGWARPEGD